MARDPYMEKTLGELARWVEGEVQGDAQTKITGVAGLTEARSTEISFVVGAKYARQAIKSRARALIVPPNLRDFGKPLIVTANPYLAFAKILSGFCRKSQTATGVSPEAHLGSNVRLGDEVAIHPQVYVGDGTVLGDRVTLYPGVYVGAEVHIGDDTLVYPNVTILDRCLIGKRVMIHSGTVVGSDGFGFARDGDYHFKIPQVGIVQIDNDVEIGANCAVDRATMGKTWIQRGVKIDNLVQIAHNVVVGEDTIIVAQVGIAGSARVGKNVILAGQAGIADHLEIGDRVRVGPQAGVSKSIVSGQTVLGSPAIAYRNFWRNCRLVNRLPEIHKNIIELERRLAVLEQARDSGQEE